MKFKYNETFFNLGKRKENYVFTAVSVAHLITKEYTQELIC